MDKTRKAALRFGVAVRDWRRDRRGTATIEIGMLFPLVLAALIPTVEYARYIYTKRLIVSELNEGARFAAFNASNPDVAITEGSVRNFVVESLGEAIVSAEDVAVTFSPDASPGSRVTVAVNLPFQSVTAVFGEFRLDLRASRTLL